MAAGVVAMATAASRPATRRSCLCVADALAVTGGGVNDADAPPTPMPGPGGRAGNGGGALEVTARDVIDVSGTLKAAGSGGGPPPYPIILVNGGGGAGGSGGAILLDRDTVHVEASGALCANGGGGGEGGQGGAQSSYGEDGRCSAAVAASDGMIQAHGGNGGAGGRLGATTDRSRSAAPRRSGSTGTHCWSPGPAATRTGAGCSDG